MNNNLKDTFIDINPIIRIYCNKRKILWFKDIKKCSHLVKNPYTCIIYIKNGVQQILEGFDYEGPNILNCICSTINQAKDVTLRSNKFYFYIRGHIRDSFKTNRLRNFIELLKLFYPNIIFILQTWKQQECKKHESWRGKNITENNTIITKSTIQDYFEDKNITNNCIIIDENSIELIGSTHGKILDSLCPKKGWKNMWYGIYKGIQNSNINKNDIIVSFRYDYFNIDPSRGITEKMIIKFINTNFNTKNISFLQYMIAGTDNLYIGRYEKIMKLVENFHFRLDDIINYIKLRNKNKKINFTMNNVINKSTKIVCHEFIVNIISNEYK
jgi:hypothetical protein